MVALGSALSAMGNSFRYIAIMALITQGVDSKTGVLRVALLTAAALLPNVAVGRRAGIIVQKIGAKRTLILAETGRALLTLAFPIFPFAGMLIVNVCFSLFSALYAAGFGSFVPTIVSDRGLVRGNSVMGVAQQAAGILGPALAGWTVAGFGTRAPFYVDSVSFLINAMVFAFTRSTGKASDSEAETNREDNHRLPPSAAKMMWAAGIGSFCGMLAGVAFPVLFLQYLRLGIGTFGTLMSINACGAIFMGIFLGTRKGLRASYSHFYAGMGGVGVAMLIIGVAKFLWLTSFALFLGGLGNGAIDVVFPTLLQNRLKPSVLPIAFGVANAWQRGGQMLALLLSTALSQELPVQVLLVVGAVGYLSMVVVGMGSLRGQSDWK